MLSFLNSEKLAERAKDIDGDALAALGRLPANQLVEGAYPSFISHSRGAFLWDVDGNRFLDFMLAFGTVVLGHADPDVENAVISELRKGVASAIHKTVRLELIDLMREIIPGAESVMLLKTGSDATTAAVRLAQIFTHRSGIIRWGYHGWHDWCCPRGLGISPKVRENVTSFEYNSLESLKKEFESRRGEIACLIMMPFELDEPKADFLHEAKAIAHHYGALFILDEIRSGFRISLGGAQQKYGVTADLALYSKAIANGFEISAITGRTDVLRGLAETHVSSTFFRNSLPMAAAIATIRKLRETRALEHIDRLGTLFLTGISNLIRESRIPARTRGVPSMPFLEFVTEGSISADRMRTAFFREVTSQGVLLFPSHHWFLSAAMTEEDIQTSLRAFAKGFQAVAELKEL